MMIEIPEQAATEEKLLQLTDALESIKQVLGDIIHDMNGSGEAGYGTEDALDALDDAMEALDDAIDSVGDAVDVLEEQEMELDEEADVDPMD